VKNKPFVSVLMCSRSRSLIYEEANIRPDNAISETDIDWSDPDLDFSLGNALESLYQQADLGNMNFEVIVKVDFDDWKTIDYIKTRANSYENLHFIVNSRRKGYKSLDEFHEEMINFSTGKYIFMSNDDMRFITQGWNTVLEQVLVADQIYFPFVNDYREAFFIIPRSIRDVLGYMAPHSFPDTYLRDLGQVLGINNYLESVELHHQCLGLCRDDDTHETSVYHKTSPEFKNDIRKLKDYLGIDLLYPLE